MPGMPLHLEKGFALMALEDLFNDGAHHALLRKVFDGLRPGHQQLPLGELFAAGVKDPSEPAPLLDAYPGNAAVAAYAGLGNYVASAWFGEQTGGQPAKQYWIDYSGDIEGVVREALLLAMEVAWGVSRLHPLPHARGADWRAIELFWHCAQRWFEAWVTWKPNQPVQLLFATPPHTGGPVQASILDVVDQKYAEQTDAATSQGRPRDMVVVCQERHVEKTVPGITVEASAKGVFALPFVAAGFEGVGAVKPYSVFAKGGGSRPAFTWS